jgi:hypothetical protein
MNYYNTFKTKFGVNFLKIDKLPISGFYYKGNEGVSSPWPQGELTPSLALIDTIVGTFAAYKKIVGHSE